jgi:hypothetical protein
MGCVGVGVGVGGPGKNWAGKTDLLDPPRVERAMRTSLLSEGLELLVWKELLVLLVVVVGVRGPPEADSSRFDVVVV